jgi:ElaA protein
MDREDILWKLKPFERLTAEELYQVMRLRSEVFVVEQQCVYLDADNKDQGAFHLLGYKGRTLIAYARLFAPGAYFEEAAIGRIVTAPEVRRNGVGKALMEESLELVRRMYGAGPVRIGAQKYLVAFYGLFGFQVSGEEYLEDGIPHVEMVLG